MRSGWSWHTCTAVPRARPLGLKNVFLNSGYPVKKLQHGNAARNQTTGIDETQAVLGKSRFPLVLVASRFSSVPYMGTSHQRPSPSTSRRCR